MIDSSIRKNRRNKKQHFTYDLYINYHTSLKFLKIKTLNVWYLILKTINIESTVTSAEYTIFVISTRSHKNGVFANVVLYECNEQIWQWQTSGDGRISMKWVNLYLIDV